MAWRIPLSDLDYGREEEQAVLDVLRGRWLSMGPRTEAFEAACAARLGVKHALAVANGTCALELAYQQMLCPVGGEISESDDDALHDVTGPKPVVIVPAVTFVATANAALMAGADVRFADIASLDEPTVDETGWRAALTGVAPDATVILAPVHLAGFECDMTAARRVASDIGARVVEDAAHAIGGVAASGGALGAIGHAGCFSFFSNKNVATGEGGLLATDDDGLARGFRLLRSHGMTSLTWRRHAAKGHGYDVLTPGHNHRCTEITAALGLVQLGRLDAGNARRRHLWRLYREAFAAEPRLRVPFGATPSARTTSDATNPAELRLDRSACHIFPLLVESPALRDRVRDALNEAGIQTSHHYPAVHSLTAYRRHFQRAGRPLAVPDADALGAGWPDPARSSAFPLPAAVHWAAREITLPLHPNLKDVEAEETADIVLRIVRAG